MLGVRGKLIIGLLGASAAAASAEISDRVFRVQATNANGTAVWEVPFDENCYSRDTDTYAWELSEPVTLRSADGTVIGTVGAAGTTLIGDPVVNLNFLFVAGAANTAFSVSSALLSFPPITSAVGQASAQIGSTDLDGNGVTITGGYVGNTKGYLAQYNGFVPTGTTFATLVDNQTGGAFSSNIESESVGVTPIGATVSDMSSQFSVVVSAHDQVSGTSVYVITPEPAALALLGLGGLALLRRRS